jgi:signal transduction histidine kinase
MKKVTLSRWWPKKVRTRLTLLYALLFLAAGSVILGLTYGLVASRIPAQTARSQLSPNQSQKLIRLCKDQPQPAKGATAKQAPGPISAQCQKAFAEGAISGSQDQRDQALHDLLLFSLLGLAVMTVASGALGWIVSGRVLRPVRAITETAKRASEQHLGERLDLSGPQDELKELADTFDEMLERLDEAFAGQKRFVANASHELRTPLTVMRTAIDVTLAKTSPSAEQLEAMARKVGDCVDRAEHLIDALLTLAISDKGQLGNEFVDLATSAEDAIDAVAGMAADKGVRVETDLQSAETIGDRYLLDRMVSNLLENGVRHNQPGGWVRVRTGMVNGNATLAVANTGPHVADESIPGLLEPFGRSEARSNPAQGVGLGLSVVNSIVLAHDAALTVGSRVDGGLDVSVVLGEIGSARRTGGAPRQLPPV